MQLQLNTVAHSTRTEYIDGSSVPGRVEPGGREIDRWSLIDDKKYRKSIISKPPYEGKEKRNRVTYYQVSPLYLNDGWWTGGIKFNFDITDTYRGEGLVQFIEEWEEPAPIQISETGRYFIPTVRIWLDWARDDWGNPRNPDVERSSVDDEYYYEPPQLMIITNRGYVSIDEFDIEDYVNQFREIYSYKWKIDWVLEFLKSDSGFAHFLLYCRGRDCKREDYRLLGRYFSDPSDELVRKAETVNEDATRFFSKKRER